MTDDFIIDGVPVRLSDFTVHPSADREYVTCPDNRDPGEMVCPGLRVRGVQLTPPHPSSVANHTHNAVRHREGRAHCYYDFCRACDAAKQKINKHIAANRPPVQKSPETKVCGSCGQERHRRDFGPNKRYLDSLEPTCRACRYRR